MPDTHATRADALGMRDRIIVDGRAYTIMTIRRLDQHGPGRRLISVSGRDDRGRAISEQFHSEQTVMVAS